MMMLQTLIVGLLASVIQGQRTPTISYITPSITTKIGGTIEMDCSVLYATEYPILWVKLPSNCEAGRETYNYRTQEADSCTPVPLSQGSALIITDTRFRYNPIIHTTSFSSVSSSWSLLSNIWAFDCSFPLFKKKFWTLPLVHRVWKWHKKFHLTLRAKRATFTSNSVTRQVNFNRTKIGGKCRILKIQMRHFEEVFKQCVVVLK